MNPMLPGHSRRRTRVRDPQRACTEAARPGRDRRERAAAPLGPSSRFRFFAVCALFASFAALGEEVEEKQALQRTFAFDEAAGPMQVEVDNFEGSIQVSGHSGRELRLTVVQGLQADSQDKAEAARRDVRLDITQSNNIVRCFVDGPFRCKHGSIHFRGWRQYGYKVRYDFELQVPPRTGLHLKTVNGEDILVEKTEGKFEIENINGEIGRASCRERV